MKKIIKMTETDLTKLVRRILKEEGYDLSEYDNQFDEEFIKEDEEGGEEKSSEKSTSTTAKKWQGQRGWENVTRGKANPISFKSVWQSGISRGPGNPI